MYVEYVYTNLLWGLSHSYDLNIFFNAFKNVILSGRKYYTTLSLQLVIVLYTYFLIQYKAAPLNQSWNARPLNTKKAKFLYVWFPVWFFGAPLKFCPFRLHGKKSFEPPQKGQFGVEGSSFAFVVSWVGLKSKFPTIVHVT